MMGAHHAACGAAAWVAVTATAPYTLGWHPVSPLGVMAGAIVCAGAALLPDADHHGASIARSLPPFSGMICRGLGTLAGGHRQGTHSLLATAIAVVLALAASFVTVTTDWAGELAVGAGLITVLLFAFAARALRLTRDRLLGPWAWALGAAAFVMWQAPTELAWLPLAVGIGYVAHLAGDMLTTGGVPLLWPLKPKPPAALQGVPLLSRVWQPNGFFAVPILGNTGSAREWALAVPISLYAAYGIAISAAAASGMPETTISDALTALTK